MFFVLVYLEEEYVLNKILTELACSICENTVVNTQPVNEAVVGKMCSKLETSGCWNNFPCSYINPLT